MDLGKRLNRLCKERGLSLSELARLSSVPVQTLHGWTTGRKAVQLEQLKRIASALKVSVHELAYGEPDPYEPVGEEILRELFSGDVRVTVQRIERKKR